MGEKETAARTSNLNPSKSNINREGGHTAGSEDDAGRLSTNMTTERQAQNPQVGGGGTPLEASNLNLSKSNINREGGHTAGSEDDAGRLSTNMTIERQTPKRDFGDRA